MGYYRAGFDVVGVDIKPQPRYPFEFHQADAMTYPLDGFDAIHASPPCQMYSENMRHLSSPQPMLIEPMRERLEASGTIWVIENVEGAPLLVAPSLFSPLTGIILCGTVFGLRVWRHRLFESNAALACDLPCNHLAPAMNPHKAEARARYGWNEAEWRDEMGLEWMNGDETREAIPPAYTEFIGAQLLRAVAVSV